MHIINNINCNLIYLYKYVLYSWSNKNVSEKSWCEFHSTCTLAHKNVWNIHANKWIWNQPRMLVFICMWFIRIHISFFRRFSINSFVFTVVSRPLEQYLNGNNRFAVKLAHRLPSVLHTYPLSPSVSGAELAMSSNVRMLNGRPWV